MDLEELGPQRQLPPHTQSFPVAVLNDWFPYKPLFRFRDHGSALLMTADGWNAKGPFLAWTTLNLSGSAPLQIQVATKLRTHSIGCVSVNSLI